METPACFKGATGRCIQQHGACMHGLCIDLCQQLSPSCSKMHLPSAELGTCSCIASSLQVYFSKNFATSLLAIKDGHVRARLLHQLQSLANGTWPTHLRTHNAGACVGACVRARACACRRAHACACYVCMQAVFGAAC